MVPCNCRDVAAPAPGQAQTLLMVHLLRDKRLEQPQRRARRGGDRATSHCQAGTSLPPGTLSAKFSRVPLIPGEWDSQVLHRPALAWLGPDTQTGIATVGSLVSTETGFLL